MEFIYFKSLGFSVIMLIYSVILMSNSFVLPLDFQWSHSVCAKPTEVVPPEHNQYERNDTS